MARQGAQYAFPPVVVLHEPKPYWVQSIAYGAPPTHTVIVLAPSQDSTQFAACAAVQPGETHNAAVAPFGAHVPPAVVQS
jgi:hypothetical protein